MIEEDRACCEGPHSAGKEEVAKRSSIFHRVRWGVMARPSDPSNIAENFGAVSIPHCRCDRLHKICFVLKVFLEMIINHSAVDVMARLGDHLSQGRLRGLRRQIIPTAVKAMSQG